MPAFDKAFFDDLASLDAAAVVAVLPTDGHPPSISNMLRAGKITRRLADTSHDFVTTLARRSRNRYRFGMDFRIYLFHITDFADERAFRLRPA